MDDMKAQRFEVPEKEPTYKRRDQAEADQHAKLLCFIGIWVKVGVVT